MATTNNGKDGGLLKGKPHYDKSGKSLGGIKAIVTDTKQMVELEGGEVIINKEASKKHWKELSRINQSAGNGVPILPPDKAMADTEEYKQGGRTIEFNTNHIPNKWVYDYAKKIKDKHPKVWALGGNEFGNKAFENLERALKRGYWTENEEWMYVKWQSFNARHKGDFRIAGVIANLKWLNKVDKGWDFMKHLIESEIKKKENKLETGGELAKGIKSEREHIGTATKLYNRQITPKQAPESIAKEHLAEDSQYYTKLEEFESKFDTGGTVVEKGIVIINPDREYGTFDLMLNGDRVSEFGESKKLLPIEKIEWGLWRRNLIQDRIDSEKGVKTDNLGVKWANKNAQSLKSKALKDLMIQRDALDKFIISQLPTSYDLKLGGFYKYTETEINKLFKNNTLPKYAIEKLLPETVVNEPEEQKPTHKEFLVKYYINTGKKHNVKTYICAQNRNEAIDIAKKDDDRYTELISCKPTGNTSWSSSCNKEDAEFDENDEGADEEKHFDSNYKPIFWHLTQSEFCEYAENYEVDTRLDGTKARLECKDFYKYVVVLPLLDDSAERNVFLLAVETGLLPYEKVKEIIESVGAWKENNRFVKELLDYDKVKNYSSNIWLIPKDLYLSSEYYKNNYTTKEVDKMYSEKIYKNGILDNEQLRSYLSRGIVKLKDVEARLKEANISSDKFVDKLKDSAKTFSSKNKLKGLKLLLEDDSPDKKKEHLGKLIDETVERLKKKYKNIENLSEIDINTVNNRQSVIDWVSNSKDVTLIIAFSGGKDSIALVLYALFELKIPKERIELWHHEVDGKGEQLFDWACTPSYCEAFAKAFDLKMYSSYAEGGILDAIYRQDAPPQSVFYQSQPEGKFNKITTKGSERFLNTRLKFPAVASDLNKRWCSSVVKIDVMSKVINNWDRFKKSKVCVMTGERRTESTNRAKYDEVDNSKNTINKQLIQWRAIIDWDEQKVWDIIKEHKVQPHPCYELGWNRCSCQLCIFSSANTWASINEINPEKVKRIAEIEKDLDAKGSAIVKAETENPSLIKWKPNKETKILEPKPFINLPYLYGDKIKVEEFIPAHTKITKSGKMQNIKGKVGKVWKGERADIYESKVNKGVSYIPKELKERWSKEANGTFISPIIVDEWKLPIGAFKTEEGGAN
jgi:3'-phosphoadenosine 5'-phosphosulfate sulfotransferase (PAPS reductase)/FAD synthetase